MLFPKMPKKLTKRNNTSMHCLCAKGDLDQDCCISVVPLASTDFQQALGHLLRCERRAALYEIEEGASREVAKRTRHYDFGGCGLTALGDVIELACFVRSPKDPSAEAVRSNALSVAA